MRLCPGKHAIEQGARRNSLPHPARAGRAWYQRSQWEARGRRKPLWREARAWPEGWTNQTKKRSSLATSVRELLSPDLRCFWNQCGGDGKSAQEYGRTMVFSNLPRKQKVIEGSKSDQALSLSTLISDRLMACMVSSTRLSAPSLRFMRAT